MSGIAKKVETQERKVADLERELAKARIELDVWREAVTLEGRKQSSNGAATNGHGHQPKRRGKAKGAISGAWKSLLGLMVDAGNNPMDYEAIHKMSKKAGMEVEINSIRERARAYAKEGILDKDAAGLRVSKQAIEKYELSA
jgi:hypothetical protein